MSTKSQAALLRDELRQMILTYVQAYTNEDRRGDLRGEHERRASALQAIGEILQWKRLEMYPAAQLEILESLLAYWRECEVEIPGVAEPDELQ